jgi:hypothetical protein
MRGDHEYAIRLGIRNVDYSQVPARSGLANRNSGTFATRTVFARILQDLNHLIFAHLMAMHMWQPSGRIDIKSRFHTFVESILTPKHRTFEAP